MSSTQITVGLVDGKSNCKVLKPPGGGSSDIFGDDQAMGTPYRTGKNRMQSNIFAEPQNGGAPKQADARRVPVPGTGGADSHDRLFGEPNRNFVTAKNNLKSSIPIGDVADGGAKMTNGKTNGHSNGMNGHANGNGHVNGNGHTNGKGTSENGHGHTNGNGYASSEAASVRKDGNPVTGEGYKSNGAEINTQVPSLNGSMSQLPSTPSHVVNKNRIPPGGYSKGLW